MKKEHQLATTVVASYLQQTKALFLVPWFVQFHVLYTFQAGFTLANAPVPFWHCRNLVPV